MMANRFSYSINLPKACKWPLLILLTGALLTAPLHAQDEDGNGKYLLSESTYKALGEINELLQADRNREALTKLETLQKDVAGDDYESAVVQQTLGYAYNGLERYEQAAEAFVRAVESNALPPDVSHKLEYFIAQLYAQNRQYKEAILYLERWLDREDNPDVDAHRLAAGLYYEAGAYGKVSEHARLAISKSRKADESLYQLLLASYFETRDYSRAAALLEDMLQLFPENQTYWKQLYSTYQLLKQEKKALAVYELAYRRDFLSSEEKEELARLYLHLQAPYRAARFLESELERGAIERTGENLKLLADSYYLAQETDKAIEAYGRAASKTDDSELYFRQGQLLVKQEQWQEARQALLQALQGDSLKYRPQAHLLLGIAAYKLNDNNTAREELRQASQSDETRQQAEYWLNQLEQQG